MNAMSSIQYTIGTALERAREAGSMVEVLVENHWLTGLVVANDGIGVVLDNRGDEHCVVRTERISAVRVCAQTPALRRIPGGQATGERVFDVAMPMPAAHAASA